jgi:hypothetical protein
VSPQRIELGVAQCFPEMRLVQRARIISSLPHMHQDIEFGVVIAPSCPFNIQLAKLVLEIGTASLRNFVELGKLWHDLDLSSYSLYLMPLVSCHPRKAPLASQSRMTNEIS